jgi:ASC-1-like (ASCH) protein
MSEIMKKEISKPWLQILKDGPKIFEGRLNRGFWKNVEIGVMFIGYDGTSLEVLFEVVDKKFYASAGEGWNELKERLIPIEYGNSTEEIDVLYGKFYTKEQFDEYGFVAVELKVVK